MENGRVQIMNVHGAGRGLSCSSHAMPWVRKKVGTFHKFGISSLQQVYTESALSRSLRLEVNTLESGWLINESKRGVTKFAFQPLPRMAQIAPAFGVVLTDFEGNGHTDAFLAQNFYAPQHETGHMDGGLSLWLRGHGKRQFQVTGPRLSGISVRGDAKGAALTDFNQDACPDVIVSVNDGVVEAYDNRAPLLTKNRFLKIVLTGKPGNPACIGARVRLRFADETQWLPQLAEVRSGGSYLSQSTRALFFGCGTQGQPKLLEIDWPDGRKTEHKLTQQQGLVTVAMP